MHHDKSSFKRDFLEEDWNRKEQTKKHFVRNEYDPEYDKTPRRSARTVFVHTCTNCGKRHEGDTMQLPPYWKNTAAGIQCPDCADGLDDIVEVQKVVLG